MKMNKKTMMIKSSSNSIMMRKTLISNKWTSNTNKVMVRKKKNKSIKKTNIERIKNIHKVVTKILMIITYNLTA